MTTRLKATKKSKAKSTKPRTTRAAMSVATSDKETVKARVAAMAEVPLAVCDSDKDLQSMLSALRDQAQGIVDADVARVDEGLVAEPGAMQSHHDVVTDRAGRISCQDALGNEQCQRTNDPLQKPARRTTHLLSFLRLAEIATTSGARGQEQRGSINDDVTNVCDCFPPLSV